MFRPGVASALFVLLLAGCTTPDANSNMPRGFLRSKQGEIPKVHELVPGDTIEVSVEVDGNMEVSLHRAKLNYQGMTTLPLVGDVKVGGLKLVDARDRIAAKYSEYYVNPPVVMLALMDDGEAGEWGHVTVLGRVSRPGLVPLTSHRGINLSAAIQAAGGFASSAKTSEIRVSRTDKKGKKTQVAVNFEQIGQEGNVEADILLLAGDIVYVPERIF
jgi:polysaccharide export outer membrane protein